MNAMIDPATVKQNRRVLGWLLAVVTLCFCLSYFLRPFLAEELVHGKRSTPKHDQQPH